MSIKNWVLSKVNKENALRISSNFNLPFFLSTLLDVRKFSDEKIESEILYDEYDIQDSLSFADMKKAVLRINKAIDNFEKICIFGDYDADGVTSTSLLYLYLEKKSANVIYYIPDRNTEGYGLNINAIDKLKNQETSLIITVDNGITAVKEVEYAKSLGIDIVITDHHQVPDILPDAVAVVDPHRKDCKSIFKDLAGVGVVFKLLCALEGDSTAPEFLLYEYADLILIGTVGDVVPLKDENRVFVKRGLEIILNTQNIGIKKLLEKTGLWGAPITSTNIAFNIVPRINAAGRLSNAEKPVKLFTAKDEEEASLLSDELEKENSSRKEIEQNLLIQAENLLQREPFRLYERVLIVEGESWHPGVIGIVAAKLMDKYAKPTIIISKEGTICRGSARSIEGFSMHDAISTCNDYLLRFGGHPLAAGFEIYSENIERLKKDIQSFAREFEDMPFYNLNIDCKLNPASLSVDLIKQITPMEPFGKDNAPLLFGLYNMELYDIKPVGNGNHLRLTFLRDGEKIVAMKFRARIDEFPYKKGDILDLAVTLHISTYNCEESLSIYISDIKLSDTSNEYLINQIRTYESFKLGEDKYNFVLKKNVPNRNDFSNVYKYLKSSASLKTDISLLCTKLKSYSIEPLKLLLILDCMSELGLITFMLKCNEITVQINEVRSKVDLNSSTVLKKLGS